MSAHQVGEEIIVRWPGGPHDFVLEYYDDGPDLEPGPERYLRGVQVQPEGLGWRAMRTVRVRAAEGGGYEVAP